MTLQRWSTDRIHPTSAVGRSASNHEGLQATLWEGEERWVNGRTSARRGRAATHRKIRPPGKLFRLNRLQIGRDGRQEVPKIQKSLTVYLAQLSIQRPSSEQILAPDQVIWPHIGPALSVVRPDGVRRNGIDRIRLRETLSPRRS